MLPWQTGPVSELCGLSERQRQRARRRRASSGTRHRRRPRRRAMMRPSRQPPPSFESSAWAPQSPLSRSARSAAPRARRKNGERLFTYAVDQASSTTSSCSWPATRSRPRLERRWGSRRWPLQAFALATHTHTHTHTHTQREREPDIVMIHVSPSSHKLN